MGKHSGRGDNAPGTDNGGSFDSLSGEEKAEEFDASHSDPRGYADRNFGAGFSKDEQWAQARAEQRDQQNRGQ